MEVKNDISNYTNEKLSLLHLNMIHIESNRDAVKNIFYFVTHL